MLLHNTYKGLKCQMWVMRVGHCFAINLGRSSHCQQLSVWISDIEDRHKHMHRHTHERSVELIQTDQNITHTLRQEETFFYKCVIPRIYNLTSCKRYQKYYHCYISTLLSSICSCCVSVMGFTSPFLCSQCVSFLFCISLWLALSL